MNTERYEPDDLADAITRSRSLLPNAIDQLCAMIEAVTGRSPARERVEYVSYFWLMHVCDLVSFSESSVMDQANRTVTWTTPVAPSRRSQALSLIGSRDALVEVSDPYLKCRFLTEARASFSGRKMLVWSPVKGPEIRLSDLDSGRRLAFANSAPSPDSSIVALRQIIARQAPPELVEQHHEIAKWANEQKPSSIRVSYAANAHQSSVFLRYRFFEQRALGTKVVIHQHGGGYGIDEQHLGEDHDLAISDLFYTWGWSRPDDSGKTRVLPTAFPEVTNRTPRNRYLLMSLPVSSEFVRLQPFLMPWHVEKAIQETVTFVDELVFSGGLCIRSLPMYRFPMERLSSSRTSISEDKSGDNGATAAAVSQLVIHNYLGTSWLETLAMNVPTVCFYDPAIYRPREAARPFLEQLARVGVIHYSGREAAKFVNGFNGDPSAWWNSAEVQEAREAFVARYANFSDNWLDAWLEEFDRLLSE